MKRAEHNHGTGIIRPPGLCPACDLIFEAARPTLEAINDGTY